jgi:hypothetical protein
VNGVLYAEARGEFMGITRRHIAVFALALALAPGVASAAKHRGHSSNGSWNGRWAGAWGGSDPTAVIVKGNRVVAYEYGGATNPVAKSHVTAKKIVYDGDGGVVVTLTRTGANTAHATINSSQGNGTAELVRK